MHRAQNWDDLRYVLAVAEAGSVSKAARELGVNHATVLRRVAAFEKNSGTKIFEKSVKGYAILEDRVRVIDAAREVESAVDAVQKIISGARARVRGLVRITSTDSFCQNILPSFICDLQAQLKELRIELLSTNARLDFSRLHADITVRPTKRLDDDLRGEVAAKLGFDIYHVAGAVPDKWLGLSGTLERLLPAKWMAHHVSSDQISGSADSFVTLKELAVCGLGQVILPCVIADGDNRLVRRRSVLPNLSVNIWVASHADLADVPRIKTVRELLLAALAKHGDQLAGIN